MFIWKSNQKRCNPYASYTDENGTRFTRVPADLYEEIHDPVPPADYSDETYYRTEQDDAPYVIFTKKSDEQIAAVWWEKVKQQRDELIENGGCLHQGKWFHSDVRSKQQQIALKDLGQDIPVGLKWKTMDGTFIDMTPAIAASLFVAQIQREMGIFQIAETVKATPFATINWPERYVEVAL